MRDLHHLGPDLGHDQGHKFDPISKARPIAAVSMSKMTTTKDLTWDMTKDISLTQYLKARPIAAVSMSKMTMTKDLT